MIVKAINRKDATVISSDDHAVSESEMLRLTQIPYSGRLSKARIAPQPSITQELIHSLRRTGK